MQRQTDIEPSLAARARQIHTVYLDQNLRNLMLKSRRHLDTFNSDILHHGLAVEGDEKFFICTPGQFLEQIGASVSPPRGTNRRIWQYAELEAAKEQILNDALEHYETQPGLTPDALRSKYYEQLEYVPDATKEFFLKTTDKVYLGNGRQALVQALAWNHLIAERYPRAELANVVSSFLVDSLRGPALGHNLPCAKVLRTAWKDLKPMYLKRNLISLEQAKTIDDFEYTFSRYGDLADAELIHFTSIGKVSKDHDQPQPILAYTCDPIEKLRFRVGAFRGLVKYVAKIRDSIHDAPFKRIKLNPGIIVRCNNDLKITEILDASSLDLPVIAETPSPALKDPPSAS